MDRNIFINREFTKKYNKMNFTKIKWAGSNCILITTTDNHNPRLPIVILDENDIKHMIDEWNDAEKPSQRIKEVIKEKGLHKEGRE